MKIEKNIQLFCLNPKALSLSRRGAWGQVLIASILITILPSLILFWDWTSHSKGITVPSETIWVGGGCLIGVILLGYVLLLKYPVSIVRLRKYLSILAGGGIPDAVNISKDEDDLVAVQGYLECIVKMAEDRILMLQKHHDVELENERQRVMVESIGAMCHHLGQPASAMSICLYSLKNNPTPEEVPVLLNQCEDAFNAMSEILDKLRRIAHYCSEPYLAPPLGDTDNPETLDSRIIKE
jgi:signal transduction histidine kinase